MDDSKKKYKRSKEEIAKEFELPERKSKIVTSMKHDEEAYCICRSSDCSRFMIACDACEEWYHGDCINVTEKEAKHIKHYYCLQCKEADPSLQTVFRAVPVAVAGVTAEDRKAKKMAKEVKSREKDKAREDRKKEKKEKKDKLAKSKDRCGQCAGWTAPSCGECGACLARQPGREQRCERRICQNSKSKKDKTSISRVKRRRRSASPEIFINPDVEGDRHCYGPNCRMTARSQSKFCSDACGLKLATSRIYQVLPQRIQEWNLSRCIAEERLCRTNRPQ